MQHNNSKTWKKRGHRQALLRNALVKTMGYTDKDLEKPIIGIINTWAETNPGHFHFRQLSEAVKRGVWAAGGFPLEVNTMSICEVFFDVSSMIYRNMLSMVTEELITRHPFDGVVLMGACDKNVPAQMMAAVTANKPSIYLPGGPMLPGSYKGKTLACGTDSFNIWTKHLAGEISEDELIGLEGCLYGSPGACPIMGTANTSQAVTEAMGMALPYSATSLGVSSEKLRISEETGRQIVELVEKNIRPSDIVNEASIRNAIRILMAAGGSTNLIIHLTAIARRRGIKLDLLEFEKISNEVPVLVNVKPSGDHTVGIGLHQAGGVPALQKEIEAMLETDCLTVTGKSLSENLKSADFAYDRTVIHELSKPFKKNGGIAVLKGNLAPGGAVIKRSAASEHLLKHRGEARVFDSLEEAEKYLLDPDSDMDESKVIILRGYGPTGAPGMPEFGNYMPIPPKLYKSSINDYVRITDSRMSGGAFGTVILHVCPEANAGGPLAAVNSGDMIVLDVENNRLDVELSDDEIAARLKDFKPKAHEDFKRGFIRNFIDNVLQVNEGCDMNYL